MPAPQIECLHVGEYDMNCYLIVNPSTQELFLIDPGGGGQKIIEAIGHRTPVAVLVTHGHYDHIGAVDEICAHYGIPLYVHQEDIPKLTDNMTNGSHLFDRDMTISTEALPLVDGQHLSLAGLEMEVLHTPGHSRGSCCFLLPEGQGVFCGDTLFEGGYGRTDIADGSFSELKQSLRKLLFRLPQMTAYPGHGPFTQAGRAKDEAP